MISTLTTGIFSDQSNNDGVLTIPYPTKTGYVFTGWTIIDYESTAQTGTGQTNSSGIHQLASLTDNIAAKTKNQYFKNLTPTNNATVTFKANWKKVEAGNRAIDIIEPSMYGDKVNYNANGVSDWKIFLNGKDEGDTDNHIYLIASDYVPVRGMNIDTSLVKFNGDYMIHVATSAGDGEGANLNKWLTTQTYWEKYASGVNNATASGGASLQQFITSYNEKYGTKYSSDPTQRDSFLEFDRDDWYIASELGVLDNGAGGEGYWLTGDCNDKRCVWMVRITKRDVYGRNGWAAERYPSRNQTPN